MPRGMIPGGFGRPIPGVRGSQNMPGMGMYTNAGNTPPAPQPSFGTFSPGSPGGPPPMQGMGQRTLTPEMAAQYRPQAMAGALMGSMGGAPSQQPFGTPGSASPWGGTFGPPNQGGITGVPGPQMGIAQPTAAPQQPAMRPMPTTANRM